MRRNARGCCRFSTPRVWDAIVALLLGVVLLLGIAASAAPAGAIVSEIGPAELLLDPGTGRLYSYLYYDNRIFIMDVKSGQLLKVIANVGIPGYRYERTGIRALALDAQTGRLFAINSAARGPEGQDWTLFAIDTLQGKIVQQVSFGPSSSLPNSRLVADATHGKLYVVGDESTTVYDTATLAELTTLPGGRRALLDGEDSRLYLAGDEKLAIISTADDAVLAEIPLPAKSGWGIALDGVRGRLYVALENGIHVLDTTTQAWLDPLTEEPPPGGTMAVDPADGEVYIVGPGQGGGENQPASYHIVVLSPETGAQKTSIDFPEPAGCSAYPWITVDRLVADPAGGRIYGSRNNMSSCDSSNLAFVLDTEAETLVEWLPRSALPDTGGRSPGGGWLVWGGIGLLLGGMFLHRLHGRPGRR
jgi:DNA-binding beta-propeller fold protein YncE